MTLDGLVWSMENGKQDVHFGCAVDGLFVEGTIDEGSGEGAGEIEIEVKVKVEVDLSYRVTC